MLLTLAVLLASLVVGMALQRRSGGADRLRERIWSANFVVLIPLAAAYAFLTLELDRALLAVVSCAVLAWWLTVALAGAWATLASGSRRERGALWLVAAFPNTGFVGFPLAHLAFGDEGLRLAIVYDQVSLLVPAIVVSTIIARRHAVDPHAADAADRSVVRQALASPPLIAVLVLLVLRASVLREPLELDLLGAAVGAVVGPVGFLLLGLSLPIGGYAHAPRVYAATGGAVLVRVAAAPALLWVTARALGVEMPPAMYLIAAMPTAFHALVVSRLHDLEVTIVRMGVVLSTVLVVGGTLAWLAATGGVG